MTVHSRIFATLVLFACAALVSASDDAAAARRVDRILAGIHSLKSAFNQTLSGSRGELLEKASGTLYLEKPDRFRWDYLTGVRQQIVSDGKRVWLYDQELDQVTVRSLGESLSATPAMLLSGTGQATERFSVADLGRYENLDWIRLTPKANDTDFREIRLALLGDEIARMTLKDKLGQTTELRFHALEKNSSLDAALFQFTPPPGVDVIGKPGG